MNNKKVLAKASSLFTAAAMTILSGCSASYKTGAVIGESEIEAAYTTAATDSCVESTLFEEIIMSVTHVDPETPSSGTEHAKNNEYLCSVYDLADEDVANVSVIVYDYLEAYPEIVSEYDLDDMDVSQRLIAEISEKEREFFASIGAEDISGIGPLAFTFSISGAGIRSLDDGRCRYRVAPCTDAAADEDVDISAYFGEYRCERVFTSLLSSESPVDCARLVLGSDSLLLTGEEGVIMEQRGVLYERDTENDCAQRFYGFEYVDYISLDEQLAGALAGTHTIIDAYPARFIISGDEFFFVLRTGSIYKLTR